MDSYHVPKALDVDFENVSLTVKDRKGKFFFMIPSTLQILFIVIGGFELFLQ